MATTLFINGAAQPLADGTPADTPLLDILRNTLGLTGTRFGCGLEQCGACMVLVDGRPVQACTAALDAVLGKQVTTVEGLAGPDGGLHPLQQAFLDEQAGQCGYCLSGILISAAALLERNPKPSRAEIAAALDGHLCRCGSHVRILKAIERAAAHLRGEG
ncbi:MAG: (2Fe-2S)-binding protein [Alphaproteobacteria bacterium]|nr:(2Fe-2S)-binding protein [Alphaproteobacteria bacterium]MCB9928248.1 (2Fe-2S)-binding protein [Alphaproteobacteria bacterium]